MKKTNTKETKTPSTKKPDLVDNASATNDKNENKNEREVKEMKESTTNQVNEKKENPYSKYIDMVKTLLSECGLKYEYRANQNRHFFYNPDLMKSVQRQFMITFSKRGARIATREEYNSKYEGVICHYNLPLAISTDYSNLRNVILHLRSGYKNTMKEVEKAKKEREKEEKKAKEKSA